ncbi:hypothetical protein E0493_16635 [Roseomonas sp. M0104]|uniref:Lipoprotein n=1 Tax=Teichococcus coralli TaxID=2545983 RepID=A0A845BI52_9PROT|nr:hypothetical protein [Pseudoroseomonas coralli]MXP64977.1 hypothetical protein [Pseudoroseomonas coralli]
MRIHGSFRRPCCALLLLLVAGCAGWVKPGATGTEADAVLAQCRSRAEAQFPLVRQTEVQRPGYWVPSRTECGPRRSGCRTSGSFFQPPVYRDRDLNAPLRDAMIETCMRDQGWARKEGL